MRVTEDVLSGVLLDCGTLFLPQETPPRSSQDPLAAAVCHSWRACFFQAHLFSFVAMGTVARTLKGTGKCRGEAGRVGLGGWWAHMNAGLFQGG